jgi:hypothetical protein
MEKTAAKSAEKRLMRKSPWMNQHRDYPNIKLQRYKN